MTVTFSIPRNPKVLFLDSVKLAIEDFRALDSKISVIYNTSADRAEFLRDLSTKYDGVVAIYRHFKASASIKITGMFDEELVSHLPSSVRFICHNGAGYDQIDVNACTSRGIQVSNVPSAVDNATADTALFLLLGTLRQFPLAMRHAQNGTFNSHVPLSHDPEGKILGIVGLGGIGRALAKRARAFGFVVQYHNRQKLEKTLEDDLQVTYVSSLEELLSTSDAVSLNLPLTAKTRHSFSTPQFELMKPSAILVNTARGPIIDEEALVRALEKGTIAGAGLDVYENEPHIHPRLLKMDNVLCLPHVGTVTIETQKEMEAVCLRNITTGLKTGKLGFTVAEQKGVF